MEQQLTVRLPSDLAERLERAAKRMQRKRSDVIRLALEQFLVADLETKPIDKVRDLIGRIDSGVPDLGTRHREYLVKRIKNGR